MKWQIFRDNNKWTTKNHRYEYQYWKFISEDLEWVFPLFAKQGTELHEILESFTDDDISDLGSYLWSKDYPIEKYDSYDENLKSSRRFSQKVLSDFVYGVEYKEDIMKGFVVSSEDDIMAEIDFVTKTNAYKAMLTLRMRTDYAPEQDSEYYISVEDVLPIILFNSDGDEKEHSETELVLAMVDSIEEALWFLENCEEEYKGEKLCDCSVEEVYYSYDFSIESRGEIFKLKLNNGLDVSIREVYK